MILAILAAVISLGLLGLLIGAGLAVANRVLSVKIDPREEAVLAALPGTNCGACGFPGCAGYANAIVVHGSGINLCPVGGKQTAEAIAKIMGVEAGGFEDKTARVFCAGGKDKCPDKFSYRGIMTCQAADLVGGGSKACSYGCLGLGSCVQVCPFDAIKMGEDAIPVVDEEKCTACGHCVSACPRNLIKLIPVSKRVIIACSSLDRGPDTRNICKVGCIACRLCEKFCPVHAIVVKNNLAYMDFDKCTNQKICVQKCPPKTIRYYPEKAPR